MVSCPLRLFCTLSASASASVSASALLHMTAFLAHARATSTTATTHNPHPHPHPPRQLSLQYSTLQYSTALLWLDLTSKCYCDETHAPSSVRNSVCVCVQICMCVCVRVRACVPCCGPAPAPAPAPVPKLSRRLDHRGRQTASPVDAPDPTRWHPGGTLTSVRHLPAPE